MTDSSGTDRDARLEAALVHYLEAAESGRPIDHDEFLSHYPDLSEELAEFLSNRRKLSELAMRLQKTLVSQAKPHEPPRQGDAAPPLKIRYFGDYEILNEVARGGMGVVYRARQQTLNRIVALKMILAGQLAGQEDVKRFHAEAEAAAKLDHPHIVPVFEIGQHEGQHYFSMAFIEGESLARRIVNGPLPPRDAARIMKRVAEAVAYAHIEGVVHRDLKPANVLLDRDGQPRVTDFGLSKRITAETLAPHAAALTQTGQLLGSPSYMAPEQASGDNERVGPRSDVYSMGATLYCLLTGRPPFQSASPVDTILQVVHHEPVPLRRLNSKVPRDLDRICLKCLEKDPRRRYASAHELLDDLNRFLEGRPVKARANSLSLRAAKWARRRPAAAALVALLVAGTLLLLAAGLWFDIQVRRERDYAREKQRLATERLGAALREQARAERVGGNRARALGLIAEAVEAGADAGLRDEAIQALTSPGVELRHELPFGHACTMAFSPDGSRLAVHGRFGHAAQWSAGEPPVDQGSLVIWHPDTGEMVAELPLALPAINLGLGVTNFNPYSFSQYSPFALSPLAGQFALSGHKSHTIEFHSRQGGDPFLTVKAQARGPVVYSDDGTLVAIMLEQPEGHSQVWDVDRGEAVGPALLGQPIAFVMPDELLVSDASRPRRVDFHSGDVRASMADELRLVAVSRNGHTAALSTTANRAGDPVHVWDLLAWSELATIERAGSGPYRTPFEFQFSPDGRYLAYHEISSPNTLKVWDRSTGSIKASFPGRVYAGQNTNWNQYQTAAFSPNGRLLVAYRRTGAPDLQVWDVEGQRPCGELSRDHSPRWSPDGRWLATLVPHTSEARFGKDRITVRIWEVAYPPPGFVHPAPIDQLRFDHESRRLAVNDTIWDVTQSATRPELQDPAAESRPPFITFDADGDVRSVRFPANASQPQRFETTEAAAEETRRELDLPPVDDPGTLAGYSVNRLQVDCDAAGARLAMFCEAWQRISGGGSGTSSDGSGYLRCWDLASGTPASLWAADTTATRVIMAPSGNRIATVAGATIQLWNPQDGARLRNVRCARQWTGADRLEQGFSSRTMESPSVYRYVQDFTVHHVAFSPDESRLYAATDGGHIFVFETATGRQLDQWNYGTSTAVRSLSTHVNAPWLAAGSDDGFVRLIDASSGESFARWQAHGSGVSALAWSADRRWLASGCDDGSASLWDVPRIHEGLAELKLAW